MPNAPRGREKNVTGGGSGAYRRGSGLGTGPVGSGEFHGGSSGGYQGGSGGTRGPGGGGGLIKLIIILAVVLLGGGGGLASFLGGSSSEDASYSSTQSATQSASSYSTSSYGSLLSGLLSGSVGGSSAAWGSDKNTGRLDTSVASGARDKFTTIKGDGSDTVTLMVYMCGTDLESRSGMATNDLKEMAAATLSDQVNVIVFTGGCKSWNNSVVSSQVNQIYQIKDGGMKCLESNAGTGAMTNPNNLTSFIRYCAKNFPANRNMLIFWDHGGGSISGYGYDEKYPSSGSMTLSGINTALKNSAITFDFIGFDACLMATIETDLMVASYADYMIASEETEPGVGWYYTNWLTALSKDPSMPTVELGQKICDDFVSVCATTCQGQKTTLSVVDLAELSATVPEDFKAFAADTKELITGSDYKQVSDARSGAREFAASSRIDQIDLVSFASNLGTSEGEALKKSLLGAVKYNQTSANMTNAYGISIYFPYQKASNVDKATQTYEDIGLDDEYSDCIRAFAKMETYGQAATGGTTSPFSLLNGTSVTSGSSASGMSDITSMINMLSTGASLISGLSSSNTDFLSDRALSDEAAADYIADTQFDASALVWKENADGTPMISLSDEQWELVHSIDLQMYVDDGGGYIDLGKDNLFAVDDDGSFLADVDGTWLSINGQPVAYYHTDTIEEEDGGYTITGYVPAMLNSERVKLILIFDDENPKGYFAGAMPEYDEEDETDTIARGLTELVVGDTLDFLCDYYSYDGVYQDSYYLGDQMTVTDDMVISNTDVGGAYLATYCFTDIYNQTYWSELVP